MRSNGADRASRPDRFEPGVVDRLATQYPEVDVHAWAAWVRDFDQRKGVQNPTGLLVEKVRQAALKSKGGGLSPAQERAEMERYAAFYAEVYRVVAHQQPGPAAIARILIEARDQGLPRINPALISHLELMGASWPEPS